MNDLNIDCLQYKIILFNSKYQCIQLLSIHVCSGQLLDKYLFGILSPFISIRKMFGKKAFVRSEIADKTSRVV
ncbi:hypothetical protein BpHYR1_028344 [Brachionus plicatilis]|uniref:Uncharacterized protein n=1 Tax=Brachionus plicatilis TaxID=10195 RepID=A0A3M7P9M4_BRAPC|nr:hypothetical protein BpHYR1_028344 [Brachionus plicatilis]